MGNRHAICRFFRIAYHPGNTFWRAGCPAFTIIVERPDRNSTSCPGNFSFLFQLPNPLLQELPFGFLLGQRQSFLIRGPSLGCPAVPAVHLRAGRMRQVIICQFAQFQHRIDLSQTSLWTIAHGNGHGTIELYNGRRLNSYQEVVKRVARGKVSELFGSEPNYSAVLSPCPEMNPSKVHIQLPHRVISISV